MHAIEGLEVCPRDIEHGDDYRPTRSGHHTRICRCGCVCIAIVTAIGNLVDPKYSTVSIRIGVMEYYSI